MPDKFIAKVRSFGVLVNIIRTVVADVLEFHVPGYILDITTVGPWIRIFVNVDMGCPVAQVQRAITTAPSHSAEQPHTSTQQVCF